MVLERESITKSNDAHGKTNGETEERKKCFVKCEDQIPFSGFSFFPIEEDLFDIEKAVEVFLDFEGKDNADIELQEHKIPDTNRTFKLEPDGACSLGNATSFLYTLNQSYDPSLSSLSKNSVGSEPPLQTDNNLLHDEKVTRFKPHHEQKWNRRFQEFLVFVRENGHGAVPHTYPKNQQLARWVKRQRRQCKLFQDGKPSTITQDRLEVLASAGFIWDAHEVSWREKLDALTKFHHKHRHCVVPTKYKEQGLGMWVKSQRRQYKLYLEGKPSSMTSQRITELERLGFDWEVRNNASKDSKAGHDGFVIFPISKKGLHMNMFML